MAWGSDNVGMEMASQGWGAEIKKEKEKKPPKEEEKETKKPEEEIV